MLTDAAINCRSDKRLIGLEENVIIGKLIPAGTGINRYRNIRVQPTEEARAAAYAVPSYDDQYSPEGFGQGTGAADPLDDYGFGSDYWSRPTNRPPLRKGSGAVRVIRRVGSVR